MSRRRGLSSINLAWAIPVLAVATLTLGAWGWLERGIRPDEALYRAMILFDNGNDLYREPPGSTAWQFMIGRWTGAISLFGAGVLALGALAHERFVLALARMTRQEVVIIGGEDIALKAFDATRQARKSVVWIGAPTLEAVSFRSLILPWPPDDHVRTIASYVTAADHVLIAQSDDAGALVLARAARLSAPKAFITVMMRDARLAEDAAAMFNEPRTRVLSAASIAARALSIDHPPFLVARTLAHRRIHALIIGFGQTGQAIARDLIVNGRTTYLAAPRITIIDPNAKALEGVMRVRAPELDECAQFTFIEGRIGTHGVDPHADVLGRAIADGGPVTAAYVCRPVDAEALSTAAMLQSLLRAVNVGEPPIYVRLRDVNTLSGVKAHNTGLNSLTPFGDLDALIAASEFLSDAPDHAARAFSAAYRATLPAEKRDDPSNRSARPWDELDETFRQATRDSVAHIPAKMASARIDPALWLGVSGPPRLPRDVRLFDSEADCERLAELEHDRWNAQRRMDGWRWADLPRKDEARRLHPDLQPYEALSDATKEYDRTFVREAQLICWGPQAPERSASQRK